MSKDKKVKYVRKKIFFSFLLAIILLNFLVAKDVQELKTVEYVDIEKYMGLWYEIAKYPNKFQKNCVATTAEYTLLKNGDVQVINRCKKGLLDGESNFIKGKAWVFDKKTNTKLKVQFFWPFNGDYWVIDLGKNYEYAVVGEPKRNFLWVLSRIPEMDEKLYDEILMRLEQKGYDLKKIVKTEQNK